MTVRLWALSALALSFALCGGARAQIEPIPVPKAVIYPGDVIRDHMLTDRAFRGALSAKGNIVARRDGLVGKMARRTLLPGQPVPRIAVREPYLVRQGESRMATYRAGGLIISARITALEPGSAGEVISARNPESGLTIRAMVEPDGSLRVDAP